MHFNLRATQQNKNLVVCCIQFTLHNGSDESNESNPNELIIKSSVSNYQLINPHTNQDISKQSHEVQFKMLNALNPPPQSIQQNDHLQSIHDYNQNMIFGYKTIRFHQIKWNIHYATNCIKTVFPVPKLSSIYKQMRRINSTQYKMHFHPR